MNLCKIVLQLYFEYKECSLLEKRPRGNCLAPLAARAERELAIYLIYCKLDFLAGSYLKQVEV